MFLNGTSKQGNTLLEKIFVVEFVFVGAAIPQISWQLIFTDTSIGKKRKWKKIVLI